MRMKGNRINNGESSDIHKAFDWTALGKLVRQRAAEAISATGRVQGQETPDPLDCGSGKDSESALV